MRGPMIYLGASELMLYLPTVMCVFNSKVIGVYLFRVTNVDELHRIGLFLNDYGSADCNREIIMASVQKSDDLKDMLRTVDTFTVGSCYC